MEHHPERARALRTIDLMVTDGINSKRRRSPTATLAAVERHVYSFPVGVEKQPQIHNCQRQPTMLARARSRPRASTSPRESVYAGPVPSVNSARSMAIPCA
jgi:hypothetical protein